jgi:hypothetical protein
MSIKPKLLPTYYILGRYLVDILIYISMNTKVLVVSKNNPIGQKIIFLHFSRILLEKLYRYGCSFHVGKLFQTLVPSFLQHRY